MSEPAPPRLPAADATPAAEASDPARLPLLSLSRLGLLRRVLATADAEAAMVAADPILRQALAEERRVGRAIAGTARQTAVIIIACLLPFLNPTWGVLYYQALLGLFWLSGRLRARYAGVGRSWAEVSLILFDILLLTFIATVPNPFQPTALPAAFGFRWNTFDYLFLILALAVLSYSWRTVWTVGVAVAVVWMTATALIAFFGQELPLFEAVAQNTALVTGEKVVEPFLDLNDVQWNLRVQEVVVFLIVAAALTLKGWRSNQVLFRQARAAAERANLTRYFAPSIADRLARQPSALQQTSAHEVAVLFTDLVGFTELAERLPEAEVLSQLRRYYAAVERAVFDHGGTLDKYLGDGVMATFGTPLPGPSDAANAVRAARAVVAAVDALGLELRVSVGAHYGRAIVGDVGPDRRLEFAVLGDTVNVAARLEAATRDLSARIALSDALVAQARAQGLEPAALDGFAPCPQLALRGRRLGVDAWCWRG